MHAHQNARNFVHGMNETGLSVHWHALDLALSQALSMILVTALLLLSPQVKPAGILGAAEATTPKRTEYHIQLAMNITSSSPDTHLPRPQYALAVHPPSSFNEELILAPELLTQVGV